MVVIQMGDDIAVTRTLNSLKTKIPGLIIKRYGNLGCAAGWNAIIMENLAAPYWFILNFDIAFPPGALALLHKAGSRIFRKYSRAGVVHFWYQSGAYKPEWSAFMLRRETMHDIGFFDENFYPANGEDFDYSARMAVNPSQAAWFRILWPPTRNAPVCPRVYVWHGIGTQEAWGSGTMRMNKGYLESASRTSKCTAAANAYLNWQTNRFRIAYGPTKWGVNGGRQVNNQKCRDPNPRDAPVTPNIANQSESTASSPSESGPNQLKMEEGPVVPFSHPFGHPGLPVWFWVVDPDIRRCTLAHPRRLNEGCKVSNTPIVFDRTIGLPARCIDAIDLCKSSCTSLYDSSLLEDLRFIAKRHPLNCENANPDVDITIPPPLHSHLCGNGEIGQ